MADVAGLRPTPNRLRETLFNWLQFDIHELRVLDLFAGTGALGIEALSRGAGHATFVETHPAVRAGLNANLQRLGGSSRATVIGQSATTWLAQTTQRFDLIFVDPPFADSAWATVLPLLPPCMNAGARVYLERPAGYSAPWTEAWECLREARAGEVRGSLLQCSPAVDMSPLRDAAARDQE